MKQVKHFTPRVVKAGGRGTRRRAKTVVMCVSSISKRGFSNLIFAWFLAYLARAWVTKTLSFGLAARCIQLSCRSYLQPGAWALVTPYYTCARADTIQHRMPQNANIPSFPRHQCKFPWHWPSPSTSGALALQRVRPGSSKAPAVGLCRARAYLIKPLCRPQYYYRKHASHCLAELMHRAGKLIYTCIAWPRA